jgi:hypothetical protein
MAGRRRQLAAAGGKQHQHHRKIHREKEDGTIYEWGR